MKTIKLTSEEYIELLENERKELLRDISKKDKEIERINNRLEKEKYLYNRLSNKSEYTIKCLNKELQQKENIIKEARELLNQEWYSVLRKETITKVKEILDKENK